jgi:endonuclease/exonuclease/phosphatase family metal-dependent hydrolase
MRLASYNVENMFDRAKALNQENWAEGRPALEAHRALNALFNKPVYSAADKRKIVDLLDAQGLLRKDDGPFLILRKIRGQLLTRPRTGAVAVAATGRADWIGWVELKTEHVSARATENCARVIRAIAPDVMGVVEAEDRTTLCRFNKQVLPMVGCDPFDHVMLIDGNDERGIDVGILTRANYPIVSIRSHVDDSDDEGQIFSRDCAESEIRLPGGKTLWVLVNHFKSKGYGSPAANDAKRRRQAERVRQVVDDHLNDGHKYVAVIGDLNDSPARPPLASLVGNGSPLRDISRFSGFDDGGRPGTHGNCTASSKIDYILLSPDLSSLVTAAGVERRGMWGGTHGTLWPHFAEVEKVIHAGSDHAALWVEIGL